MWLEATAEAANMLVMNPYPGYQGKYFSMPCRNLVPKPVQKPHPPLWVACSKRETIHQAARHGLGALTFAFIDQSEAVKWVAEYYDIIKSDECVPLGSRGECQCRHGGGLLLPCRCRGSAAPRSRRLPLLRLRARPPLHLRRAHARPHQTSGPTTRRRATSCRCRRARAASARPTRSPPTCSASRRRASTRWSSCSRAAGTSTRTSARRWSCSPRR